MTIVLDLRESKIVLFRDMFSDSLAGHVLVEVHETDDGLQCLPVLSRGDFFEFETN